MRPSSNNIGTTSPKPIKLDTLPKSASELSGRIEKWEDDIQILMGKITPQKRDEIIKKVSQLGDKIDKTRQQILSEDRVMDRFMYLFSTVHEAEVERIGEGRSSKYIVKKIDAVKENAEAMGFADAIAKIRSLPTRKMGKEIKEIGLEYAGADIKSVKSVIKKSKPAIVSMILAKQAENAGAYMDGNINVDKLFVSVMRYGRDITIGHKMKNEVGETPLLRKNKDLPEAVGKENSEKILKEIAALRADIEKKNKEGYYLRDEWIFSKIKSIKAPHYDKEFQTAEEMSKFIEGMYLHDRLPNAGEGYDKYKFEIKVANDAEEELVLSPVIYVSKSTEDFTPFKDNIVDYLAEAYYPESKITATEIGHEWKVDIVTAMGNATKIAQEADQKKKEAKANTHLKGMATSGKNKKKSMKPQL